MFKRIEIQDWRQFRALAVDFHARLTVLTGANASGKTTLLNLLARHMGWELHFVSTPVRTKAGPLRFLTGLWKKLTGEQEPDQAQRQIGRIFYSAGETAELWLPASVTEQYQVEIRSQRPSPGIFVSSHRPIYLYERVDEIPTKLSAGEELFNLYVNNLRSRYQPRTAFRSPTYYLKRSLISLATFGYGNQAVQPNDKAIALFEGFQRILQIVLPPSVRFQKFEIRLPEVVLITETGDFPLDAVSGGISALIDLAWQIYLEAQIASEFVVLIDEPENHLHPELQRIVLPNLLEAFTGAQFIVATHNPFIVSSVPDSNVYVLRFVDGAVESYPLDMVNKAGSSNDILREVLGLSSTLPLWVDARIQEIADRYVAAELSEATLAQLKSELSELGLKELLPETLSRVLDTQDD